MDQNMQGQQGGNQGWDPNQQNPGQGASNQQYQYQQQPAPQPPMQQPAQQPYTPQADQQYYDPQYQQQDPYQQYQYQDPSAGMPPAGSAQQGYGDMSGQYSGGTPPPPPPPPPSKPANFQLGALFKEGDITIKIPPHQLAFEESYFLRLLAGSISLTRDEKKRIVDSVPKLRQEQIDELIRIFEEERRKFAELGEEHVPQLQKLAKQHYDDWMDLEMSSRKQSTADEDKKKAEELRKQMGL